MQQSCRFLFLLAFFAAEPGGLRAEKPAIEAKHAVVMDAFTGHILYEKSARTRSYPASATKILTALLIIEAGALDESIVIIPSDTSVVPTIIGLKPGTSVTRRALLKALLLKSANDAALALARDHSGSVTAFGEKMTSRAQALGAVESRFTNPHGLHEENHYTTGYDLALITRAALNQPYFRRLVGMSYLRWENEDGTVAQVVNRNRLLATYEGCIGVKTGFTRRAGQVLVSSALREGRELIAVVLHTTNKGIWSDSIALLDYGFEIRNHPPSASATTRLDHSF